MWVSTEMSASSREEDEVLCVCGRYVLEVWEMCVGEVCVCGRCVWEVCVWEVCV